MIRIHIYTCPTYAKQSMQAHFFKRGVYVRSTGKMSYDESMVQLITGNKEYELVNVTRSKDLSLNVLNQKD